MYLKGTFSISWIIQKGQSDSDKLTWATSSTNCDVEAPSPRYWLGFLFRWMNSVLLVKNLWLRLMPPHVIALNNALISDACTFKKLIIWQFILLRGCRVCRSNVRMAWELRNVFLSVEVTWASGRTEIQEWGSIALWTSVTGPTLATRWQEQCSQAWCRTQSLGQYPASPAIPPLRFLDQLSDLRWTLNALSSSMTWDKNGPSRD